MRLNEAEQYAKEAVRLLSPACEAIVVCGSVRRRKTEVKDLELVALPRRGDQRPVFGEPTSALPPLDNLLANLVAWGELARNAKNPKWGPRYKTLVHPRGRLPIDLFIATPENFGNQIAIRTGDADFSHLLVTPRQHGGLMPEKMKQQGGYLWRSVPVDDEEQIACPDEEAFFAALGLPLPSPLDRGAATIARLRSLQRVAA